MKIEPVGIGTYLESSKIRGTSSNENSIEKTRAKPKTKIQDNALVDKVELSYSHADLTQLLTLEEKEFLEKLFTYERSVRNLNQNLKVYTKQNDSQDNKFLGTKIDVIA